MKRARAFSAASLAFVAVITIPSSSPFVLTPGGLKAPTCHRCPTSACPTHVQRPHTLLAAYTNEGGMQDNQNIPKSKAQETFDPMPHEPAQALEGSGPPAALLLVAVLLGLMMLGASEGTVTSFLFSDELLHTVSYDGGILNQMMDFVVHLPATLSHLSPTDAAHLFGM